MKVLDNVRVPFRNASGQIVGGLILTPSRADANLSTAPLVELDDAQAREFGETAIQLLEGERYEYEVDCPTDLRLQCALSTRRRSLGDEGFPDIGLLETRSFCGTLLLELVDHQETRAGSIQGSALLDIRSVKLDFRTEYRGMVRRLTTEIADLVLDARSSAKIAFRSTFQDRSMEGWLQLQLELLRETLGSPEFGEALTHILSHPHERLHSTTDDVPSDSPIRWNPSTLRQLISRSPRRKTNAHSALAEDCGLSSVAERISVERKSRNFDTPENRFVKFALSEFGSFLAHAQSVFESHKGWGTAVAAAKRLATIVDSWSGRSLFNEIGGVTSVPLGSPILQRRSGYREILRWWLQFRTAAEVSWDGGSDLFRAGQRNIAILYEYWLFFEFLEWFCKRFRNGNRPEIGELLDGLDGSSPNLRLRRGSQLGPFEGFVTCGGRDLRAQFSYNEEFVSSIVRGKKGSWTRRLHPDFTVTIWPAAFTEKEAEENELLVRVHFDAKYRVESVSQLFGSEDEKDDESPDGNYKRQDLLKMHAYRDAIRRSQGAYVIYPAREASPTKFTMAYHEVLPGLGAFAVSPDESGRAHGFDIVTSFLEDVLLHLADRTTARERANFHSAVAYAASPDGTLPPMRVRENDLFVEHWRALPPKEHQVVVMRCDSSAQIEQARANSRVPFDLGGENLLKRVPEELALARNVLLYTFNDSPTARMLRLKRPGFEVRSGKDIVEAGFVGVESNHTFAVFDVEDDEFFLPDNWDVDAIDALLKEMDGAELSVVDLQGLMAAYRPK